MLLGVTLLRKKYPPAKYLCVLLIVAGVALFLYKPKKGAGSEDHVFGYGELLLVSPVPRWQLPAQIRPCPLYPWRPKADVETLPREDTGAKSAPERTRVALSVCFEAT